MENPERFEENLIGIGEFWIGLKMLGVEGFGLVLYGEEREIQIIKVKTRKIKNEVF